MASGYEVVDEDHGGGQEGVASEWKTIRAVFPNFAGLPAKRGDLKSSAVLKCHGLGWNILLYPGGHKNSSDEDVFVSLYLSCESSTNRTKHRIRVPSAGKVAEWIHQGNIFSKTATTAWGSHNYVKRKDFLDSSNNYLVDGNLTVEVDIQVMLDKPPAWTPTNTLSPDMLAFLDAADNADVSFEVASGDGKECLYAHGQILAARCPTLAAWPRVATPTPLSQSEMSRRACSECFCASSTEAKFLPRKLSKPKQKTSSMPPINMDA